MILFNYEKNFSSVYVIIAKIKFIIDIVIYQIRYYMVIDDMRFKLIICMCLLCFLFMSVFVVPLHDIGIGAGIGIGIIDISFALEQNNESNSKEQNDIFGIKKMYPTVKGGREWFINMEDPLNDNTFSITSKIPITRVSDDNGQTAWSINNSSVRMNVETPPNISQWKNVEITGYVKVESIMNGSDGDEESVGRSGEVLTPSLDWRARSGIHSSKSPCQGTALTGELNMVDNTASWKKEIWHTGGYTDSSNEVQASDKPLIGRWIGWKTVIHNVNNDSAVKMESYLDNSNSNHWIKVFELIDDGGWFANSSDKVFYSANCGRSKDHIVLNSGPIVTFRADNVALNFKNLSIREIDSGQQ